MICSSKATVKSKAASPYFDLRLTFAVPTDLRGVIHDSPLPIQLCSTDITFSATMNSLVFNKSLLTISNCCR